MSKNKYYGKKKVHVLFPGEYHIDFKQDAEPVIQPPRRVPESMKEAVKKELSRVIDIDIIEKVDQPTDWVNSVVYVTKPSGELRICLDPKDLEHLCEKTSSLSTGHRRHSTTTTRGQRIHNTGCTIGILEREVG